MALLRTFSVTGAYMRKWIIGMAFIVCAAAGLSAMPAAEADGEKSNPPVVVVSILPQQYFVNRIGGDDVEILVLVGPGQSPHSYEPTPRQLEKLSRAAVWILSGTDFEGVLVEKVRAQFPSVPIADGTRGVTFRSMDDRHGDLAGRHEDHDLNIDPHTWLGREPAKIMAKTVYDELSRIVPEQESVYRNNLALLVSDIDELFDSLSGRLSPLQGRSVLVYHPSFGYFLDEFDLHQEAVETGGREPTVRTLAQLMERAKSEHAQAIFVQEQFSTVAATRIADELGIPVVPLDPLSGEWMDNIRRMGDALEMSLKNNTR